MYDTMASFVQKLTWFKNYLQKNVLTYFPTSEQLKAENQGCSFSHYCKIEEIKNKVYKHFNNFNCYKTFFLFYWDFFL